LLQTEGCGYDIFEATHPENNDIKQSKLGEHIVFSQI